MKIPNVAGNPRPPPWDAHVPGAPDTWETQKTGAPVQPQSRAGDNPPLSVPCHRAFEVGVAFPYRRWDILPR